MMFYVLDFFLFSLVVTISSTMSPIHFLPLASEEKLLSQRQMHSKTAGVVEEKEGKM
jgi:hypothetical protein